MSSTDSRAFDAALDRLLNAVRAGQSDRVAYATVVRALHRLIGPLEPEVDLDDVAQEAVLRLLQRSADLGEEAIENRAAYITTVARNLAIDAVRRKQRTVLRPPASVEEGVGDWSHDDEVASRFARDASRTAVVAAMRSSVDAGDTVAVRVVVAWLDIADALGRVPTSREVGARARVSHTSVLKALRRFRSRVELLAQASG